MISTRDLAGLPDVPTLRRLMQSLATLDSLLSRDWQYRYYSFNRKWSRGATMGSMRNGCGDDLHAHFSRAGCYLKGFAHEAKMSPYRGDGKQGLWPGLMDGVPKSFAKCVAEPAFDTPDTTFCIWRRPADAAWQRGNIDFPPGDDPDGSAGLLAIYDDDPVTYHAHALDYSEVDFLTPEMFRHVYDHHKLTDEFVRPFSDNGGDDPFTLADLAADLDEIGYPARR